MDGHTGSPLDLSQTLPVGDGLLVPYSLSGSPVIKLMQMVTMVSGRGGGSVSVRPLTAPPPPPPTPRDFILKILLGNWGGGLFLL